LAKQVRDVEPLAAVGAHAERAVGRHTEPSAVGDDLGATRIGADDTVTAGDEHQIASSHHEHTVHGLDSAQELHGWTVVPYLWIPGDTPHGLGVPAGDEQLGPLGVEGHSVRVFDLAGEDRE